MTTININLPPLGEEAIETLKRIEIKLDALGVTTEAIQAQGAHMSAEMDRIEAEVKESNDVMQSAAVLLQNLGDQIRAYAGQPEKLKALADELDASQAALTAAIVANTPAAPEPTP